MGNWRRGKIRDICLGVDVESFKIFEQDDDVRKMVHLEDAEFYGKWYPTTYLDWIMSMKDFFDWCAMTDNREVHLLS